MNQSTLVKPFIKSTILDIYTSNENYLEFYHSEEFTNQEKRVYLTKMVYNHIKLNAIKSRINACINENDIEELAKYSRELAQTVIVLEQSIYEMVHTNNDSDTDKLFNEVADLYSGNMEYESIEVFETIKNIIDEMELF